MVTTKIGLALYLTLLAWSGALDVTRGESSELFKWIFFWMFIETGSDACYEAFPRQRNGLL